MYRYMAYLVCLWALWFDRGVAIGGFFFFFKMTSMSLVFPLDIDTLGLVESKGMEIELSMSLIMQHLKKKKKNRNMLVTNCFASNRLELELVFDYDNSFFMNPNSLQ